MWLAHASCTGGRRVLDNIVMQLPGGGGGIVWSTQYVHSLAALWSGLAACSRTVLLACYSRAHALMWLGACQVPAICTHERE